MTTSSGVYRRESTTSADDRRRRRQLIVSLMDPEPTLVDYLVQNGVVARPEADWLGAETDRRRQNDRLLRAIESARKSTPEVVNSVECDGGSDGCGGRGGKGEGAGGGLRLLTNALRQTGQHYLANLIDDSTRITGYRASGQISLIIRVRSVRLPVECAWRLPVVELFGGVDRVGLDELRAAISSLERDGRRAGTTSASDETATRTSGQSNVTGNGIETHRLKSNAVVPPAPPPSPLGANSRTQSIMAGVNGRVGERNLVRSLFCCCCGREQSPKMVDLTKTVSGEQISVSDDSRGGFAIRPSQLALISEHRSKNGAVAGGSDLSECVESLAYSSVHVELELSGKSANGIQESVRRQLAAEHEEGEVKRVECMSHVTLATDYVRRRRADLYASLISTSISTATDDQESAREHENPDHFNCTTPPPTADQPRRTKLVMYFEQYRGVLVLDVDHFRCDGEENDDSDGVVVACICTRRDQVDRMRRDLISGRLADDLAEALGHDDDDDGVVPCVGNGRILSEPEVSFDVAIDVGELDVAQAELT